MTDFFVNQRVIIIKHDMLFVMILKMNALMSAHILTKNERTYHKKCSFSGNTQCASWKYILKCTVFWAEYVPTLKPLI